MTSSSIFAVMSAASTIECEEFCISAGQNGTTRCVGINIYRSTVTRRLICELSSKIPDNYTENIIVRPGQESIVGFFRRKGISYVLLICLVSLHPCFPSLVLPVSLHPPRVITRTRGGGEWGVGGGGGGLLVQIVVWMLGVRENI